MGQKPPCFHPGDPARQNLQHGLALSDPGRETEPESGLPGRIEDIRRGHGPIAHLFTDHPAQLSGSAEYFWSSVLMRRHLVKRFVFFLAGLVLFYAPFALLTRLLIHLTHSPLAADAHRICLRMPLELGRSDV